MSTRFTSGSPRPEVFTRRVILKSKNSNNEASLKLLSHSHGSVVADVLLCDWFLFREIILASTNAAKLTLAYLHTLKLASELIKGFEKLHGGKNRIHR